MPSTFIPVKNIFDEAFICEDFKLFSLNTSSINFTMIGLYGSVVSPKSAAAFTSSTASTISSSFGTSTSFGGAVLTVTPNLSENNYGDDARIGGQSVDTNRG